MIVVLCAKGIFLAGSAYTLWGLFPMYFKAVHHIASMEILMHRMFWSLVFLGTVLSFRRQWAWLPQVFRQPKLILGFFTSAFLLASIGLSTFGPSITNISSMPVLVIS